MDQKTLINVINFLISFGIIAVIIITVLGILKWIWASLIIIFLVAVLVVFRDRLQKKKNE